MEAGRILSFAPKARKPKQRSEGAHSSTCRCQLVKHRPGRSLMQSLNTFPGILSTKVLGAPCLSSTILSSLGYVCSSRGKVSVFRPELPLFFFDHISWPLSSYHSLPLPATTDPHGGGTTHRSRIGGTSGGVSNDGLVEELKEVALEHVRVWRGPARRGTEMPMLASVVLDIASTFLFALAQPRHDWRRRPMHQTLMICTPQTPVRVRCCLRKKWLYRRVVSHASTRTG